MTKIKFSAFDLIIAYIASVILGLILWFPFPAVADFVGASSLIYSFLYAMGMGASWFSYLVLAWIPIYLLSIVVCCIIAKKKQSYVPFCVTVGMDLLVSLAFIVQIIVTLNCADMLTLEIGLVVRTFVYILAVYYMLMHSRRETKEKCEENIMTIKTQKILRFIPVVNFITVFAWLG